MMVTLLQKLTIEKKSLIALTLLECTLQQLASQTKTRARFQLSKKRRLDVLLRKL